MRTVAGGLIVWLGPAVVASFGCSLAWHPLLGGTAETLPGAGQFALATLIFTVGGSALLTLVFGAMGRAALAARYAVVLGLGLVVGAAWMGTAGAVYGGVTAGLWCVTHFAVFGRRGE